MRLRTQLQDELKARIEALSPDLVKTVWDHSALVLVLEEMRFKPASGFVKDWEHQSAIEGVVRVELRTDDMESHEFEPLIPSLIKTPVHTFLPGIDQPAPEVGEIFTKARLTLIEWRDALRDQMVVAALRFNIEGVLCAYAPDEFRGRDPFLGDAA